MEPEESYFKVYGLPRFDHAKSLERGAVKILLPNVKKVSEKTSYFLKFLSAIYRFLMSFH